MFGKTSSLIQFPALKVEYPLDLYLHINCYFSLIFNQRCVVSSPGSHFW